MKKQFKFISMIGALCFSLNMSAQWTWASGSSATPSINASIQPTDNAIDNAGNNYVFGTLSNGGASNATFTFGNSVLSLLSGTNSDLYLSKSNSSGTYNWVLGIGSPVNEGASSIAVSVSGDIYISGYFQNSEGIKFSSIGTPSTTIPKVIGATGTSGFIAKYNSSGVLQWAKKLTNSDGVTKICISNTVSTATSRVFAVSTFSGVANIQCFDFSGIQQWSKPATGVLSGIQAGASADNSGNFYGLFSLDIGNYSISNSATLNNTSISNANLFMCKLDVNGNYIWGQSISSGLTISGTNSKNLGLDAYGNIYITANYFSSNSISGITVPTSLDIQTFVAKYLNVPASISAPGNANWLKPITSNVYNYVTKSVVDNNGNVFSNVRTDVNATIGFNNYFSYNTGVVYDDFTVKHNASGNVDWAVPCPSNAYGSGDPFAIATDNNNGVVVSGQYTNNAIFGATSLNAGSNILGFHAKINTQYPIFNSVYNICAGTSAVLTSSSPAGSNFKWYASLTAATPLFTGASFTTPLLTTTTTYFVSTIVGTSESVRVPVTVTVIPAPSVNAGADKTICLGSCVIIGTSAVVDETFLYSWSIGASVIANSNKPQISVCPTATTTYTVTLTNTVTGCKKTDDVIVTVDNISPNFTVNSSYTTPNNYYTIAASAPNVTGVAGFSQTWQVEEVSVPSGTTVVGSVSTTTCWANTFSTNFSGYNGVAFTTNGTNPMAGGCASPAVGQFSKTRAYKVTHKVSSTACAVKTATATPSIAARMGNTTTTSELVSEAVNKSLNANGFASNFETNTFQVFPNPSNGSFNIKTNAIESGTIEVYDRLGNKIKSITIKSDMSDYQLDLTGFAKGLYLVNLVGSDKQYSSKIVIE
jgi:Ig-like domain CHU_C associated/Secretion system C-terminal sorting domain